jgi:hypothetical protein
MKILVPLYAFGPMGHALHDANVYAAVIERTGPGWLLEFIAPADRVAFLAAIGKIGVRVLEVPRDTSTGLQSGPEPLA